MGVSKVDLNGETLIDLTGDTVNSTNLLEGATAHGADGEEVKGAVTVVPTTTSLAVTEEGVSALDGTVGKVLQDGINNITSDLSTVKTKLAKFNVGIVSETTDITGHVNVTNNAKGIPIAAVPISSGDKLCGARIVKTGTYYAQIFDWNNTAVVYTSLNLTLLVLYVSST